MKTLLIFVHGFMGSAESFLEFPKALQEELSSQGHEVHTKTYEYETKGNNQRQIQLFMDFLILHANSVEYSKVILLGHSMGGLLAVDAYINLYQLQSESILSYKIERNHTGEDMRFLTRIKGILAFDSPYFGLHQNVFVKSGINKAAEVVKTAPELVAALDVGSMVPDTVDVPVRGINVPVSTKWIKDQVLPNSSTIALVSNSTPTDTVETRAQWNWSKLAGVGALAATAIRAFGFAGPMASAVAVSHLDLVQAYSAFLNPLLVTSDRLSIVSKEHQESKVFFRAFYNRISGNGHFCVPPDESVQQHFEILDTVVQDEIDAHMYMFSEETVGQEQYRRMVERVADHLNFVINNVH